MGSKFDHHFINRKTMKKVSLSIMGLILATAATAQNPIGASIYGSTGDRAGFRVTMPDAQTMGFSSRQDFGSMAGKGAVQVYQWDGSTWNARGSVITGPNRYDYLGYGLDMPSAYTLAAGAPKNDAAGTDAGMVRIYDWDGTDYIQRGGDLLGMASSDLFGHTLSMPDSLTVAVGARLHDLPATDAGMAQVFRWNGLAWVQKGAALKGSNAKDLFGFAVSMPDSNTLAVGAYGADSSAGMAQVYEWDGTAWQTKGAEIQGGAAQDYCGFSVDMPDPQTIAVGAPGNDGGGIESGQVRVFGWNGSSWVQRGANIDGAASGNESGAVVMMPNANTLAIGASKSGVPDTNAGEVRVFRWDGQSWFQEGSPIRGMAADDELGQDLAMPDSVHLVTGAPFDDQQGSDAGQVTAYYFDYTVGLSDLNLSASFQIFPQPVQKGLLHLHNLQAGSSLRLLDAQGRVLARRRADRAQLEWRLPPLAAGRYLLEVQDEGTRQVQPLLIRP